jgi:hypothetical protein
MNRIEQLRREVLEEGNVDAMCALADELQDTDHPHRDVLVELASAAGFDDSPANALMAGAFFLRYLDDTAGKLLKK